MATIAALLGGTFQVELSETDIEFARIWGIARYQDSRARGLGMNQCAASEELDIFGCAAEIAVARLFGLNDFIPTIGSFHDCDITLPCGRGIQVRATKHEKGSLIVHDWDNQEDSYILACGDGTTFVIHGAAKGSSVVKMGQKRFFDRTYACYMMSQTTLPKLNDLRHYKPYLAAYTA